MIQYHSVETFIDVYDLQFHILCGCGGIGRRARFRFWCLRRAGSSPVIRTKKQGSHMRTLFLFYLLSYNAERYFFTVDIPFLRIVTVCIKHDSKSKNIILYFVSIFFHNSLDFVVTGYININIIHNFKA